MGRLHPECGFPGVHLYQALEVLLAIVSIMKSVSVSLWMST